jgi:hypothetical protein
LVTGHRHSPAGGIARLPRGRLALVATAQTLAREPTHLVELALDFAAIAAQSQVQLQRELAPRPRRFILPCRHQARGLAAGGLHPSHRQLRIWGTLNRSSVVRDPQNVTTIFTFAQSLPGRGDRVSPQERAMTAAAALAQADPEGELPEPRRRLLARPAWRTS